MLSRTLSPGLVEAGNLLLLRATPLGMPGCNVDVLLQNAVLLLNCVMSHTVRAMNPHLLTKLQHFVARYSVLGIARGKGRRGITVIARQRLGDLDLELFSTNSQPAFNRRLDAETSKLQQAIPNHEWGISRKILNVFLRDCLYNQDLCQAHSLDQAEALLETAPDSIVAGKLRRHDPGLPRWKGIMHLDPDIWAQYQNVAARVAHSKGYARVHLDAVWWGRG